MGHFRSIQKKSPTGSYENMGLQQSNHNKALIKIGVCVYMFVCVSPKTFRQTLGCEAGGVFLYMVQLFTCVRVHKRKFSV
jgi:hypothetical protein